jgi:hypothetical protein
MFEEIAAIGRWRSRTGAVYAAMPSADAADQHELFFQGLARSMYADGGISPGNASFVCKAFEAVVGEVYFAKDLAVGGFESRDYLIDALADDFFGSGIWCDCGKVMGPMFESTVLGGAMTVVVYDGVSQDPVEPGSGRFLVA